MRLTKTVAAALAATMILSAAGQRLLAQAAAPPSAGAVKVWTSDVVSDERAPKAAKELKPIALVAARNGTFSGKVVVESVGTIRGLRASVGALSGKGGVIPAQNVQLRYAKAAEAHGYYTPRGLDILMESPPEVAPNRGLAQLPVWVTVKVPKDVQAGTYTGEVTVQPQGAAPVKVPLNLDVQDWTLPDPQDYRTWSDFVQSPDTLAVEYKVPLWSDKHWKLIDHSFQLLSPTGGRTLYVPLICRTNFGNEQSMVRWIPKGENKYDYDFTVLDKYLDSAQRNLGRPKLVIFLVWDVCLSANLAKVSLPWWDANQTKAMTEARQEVSGKGPRVTALDPATKEADDLILPRYEDAASKALWEPMFAEVRKRMARRGLEKTMMLGIVSDILPDKQDATFWKDVSGGLPWAIHSHGRLPLKFLIPGTMGLHKIADVSYAAYVGLVTFNVNPEKGRLYGWRNPALFASYLRGGALNRASTLDVREYPLFNITGGQRGGGRMGADLWPAVRDKKGKRAGAVYARYPENNWRNLDLRDWFLAPGPDGPVATVRLESLKEGLQECEARIFLEDALLDAAKKAKIGAELAQRCQDALDEHHRAMWKTVWTKEEDLQKLDTISSLGRSPPEGLWAALKKLDKNLPNFFSGPAQTMFREESRKGQEWFAQGWQEREKKLFALAGEVAAKLGTK